jgi:hypothetical protein
MCMQCATTAAVSVGAASGLRVWLRAHAIAWMTPKRMRFATAALLTVAVLAAGVGAGGSG